jgi:hypothetical protein
VVAASAVERVRMVEDMADKCGKDHTVERRQSMQSKGAALLSECLWATLKEQLASERQATDVDSHRPATERRDRGESERLSSFTEVLSSTLHQLSVAVQHSNSKHSNQCNGNFSDSADWPCLCEDERRCLLGRTSARTCGGGRERDRL